MKLTKISPIPLLFVLPLCYPQQGYTETVFHDSNSSEITCSGGIDEGQLSQQLLMVYARFPSMRVMSDPSQWKVAASFVFNDENAAEIEGILDHCPKLYLKVRDWVLKKELLRPVRHAVVSGLSVSGMVAAALLAKAGYEVDAFELRDTYTRNIQWAGRQALVDQLASVDQDLADRFQKEVAAPIEKGKIQISLGTRTVRSQPVPTRGNPVRISRSGEELMQSSSAMIMEARVFEKFMMDYIKSIPHVRVHTRTRVELTGPDVEGHYSVAGYGRPHLIVIAEGANSITRKKLGIESVPASPARLQMAGVVHVDMGGTMTKHIRVEDGLAGAEHLLTGVMARKGSTKSWIVADVSSSWNFKSGFKKQQEVIDEEFRRLASAALEIPIEKMKGMRISGPVDGKNPQLFILQQHISSAASAGNNVVGIGDFVGNAHWSVGGGMQIGAISHGYRLKQLMLDFDLGMNRAEAMQKFSQGAIEDTLAWGRRGIADFYLSLDPEVASQTYMKAVQHWYLEGAFSPLDLLNFFFTYQRSLRKCCL
jgi:2-polyprenyl-6-methoxyphenol hydroxylase-like FAD-dependent oxidoreductase